MDMHEIRRIGIPTPKGPIPIDPTPDEIAAMTEKIRSEWSRETERSRRGLRVRYEMSPCIPSVVSEIEEPNE